VDAEYYHNHLERSRRDCNPDDFYSKSGRQSRDFANADSCGLYVRGVVHGGKRRKSSYRDDCRAYVRDDLPRAVDAEYNSHHLERSRRDCNPDDFDAKSGWKSRNAPNTDSCGIYVHGVVHGGYRRKSGYRDNCCAYVRDDVSRAVDAEYYNNHMERSRRDCNPDDFDA